MGSRSHRVAVSVNSRLEFVMADEVQPMHPLNIRKQIVNVVWKFLRHIIQQLFQVGMTFVLLIADS